MINVKCPNCGNEISLDKPGDSVFCPACGRQLSIKEKKDQRKEVLERRIEAEKEIALSKERTQLRKLQLKHEELVASGRKQKLKYAAIVAGVVIYILLMLVLWYSESNDIEVPASARKYRGQNYKKVVEELQDSGFKSIKIKAEKSKLKGGLKKNCVKSISIAGQDAFKEGDAFEPEDVVRIVYYTK